MRDLTAAVSSAVDYGSSLTVWAQTQGLRVVAVSLVSFFAYQIIRRIIDKAFHWRGGRESGRRATLHAVVVLTLRIFFGSAVVLLILPEFGISTGPLIASLGIFGLAFSFGAQTLVRDLVSGFFLLAEDLCRVGEEVTVAEMRGRVEGLRIRTLVLQQEGKNGLVFIPYGEIKSLKNHSRSSV